MSVRGLFRLTDPERAEATLTLTMDVGEWKTLRTQLKDGYPSWRVGSMIGALIDHASQTFAEQVERDG